jgi:DNA helicase-2/ATP-dependent DNA helicase PcrA
VYAILDDTDWKQEYNFDGYFDDTDDNPTRKLSVQKNLFYVTYSRAEDNLVVLMLSPSSVASLDINKTWFGNDRVIDVEEYLRV